MTSECRSLGQTIPGKKSNIRMHGLCKAQHRPFGRIRSDDRKLPGRIAALPDVHVESEGQEEGKVPVKVSVGGSFTQKTYDRVVRELAASTPAMPGFRKSKGGKNANIPSKMIVQMLGQKRVSGFVVETIVTDVLADWAEEEGIEVDKQAKVDQKHEELVTSFKPGKALEFTAVLNLVQSDVEETEGVEQESSS